MRRGYLFAIQALGLAVALSLGVQWAMADSFTLDFGEVKAFSGEDHVLVPVLLSSSDSVGAWEIVVQYDSEKGHIGGAELSDSVCAKVDGGDWNWYYAPWAGDPDKRPELFTYHLNDGGHANQVRIIAYVNLPYPVEVTPPIPPGEDQVLFSLIVDIHPTWTSMDDSLTMCFEVRNCTDNSLGSPDGSFLWTPDDASRPSWLRYCNEYEYVSLTCPCWQDSDYHCAAVGLDSTKGDINCDGTPYSVGDAMMCICYMIYGHECLKDHHGEYYCGSFDVHCYHADLDEDGHCFTVCDMIRLIRVINGYDKPLQPCAEEQGEGEDTVAVTSSGESGQLDMWIMSSEEIGGSQFTFSYDPQNVQVGTPELTDYSQAMGMDYSDSEGALKIIIYSLACDTLPAGHEILFTVPVFDGSGQNPGDPHDLLLEDASFSDGEGNKLAVVEIPDNLISNGGFEFLEPGPVEPFADWKGKDDKGLGTIEAETDPYYVNSGSKSCKVKREIGHESVGVFQTVECRPLTTYDISIYMKYNVFAKELGHGAAICVNGEILGDPIFGENLDQFLVQTRTYSTGPSENNFTFELVLTPQSEGTVWFDDVVVK
jgi:hypothetical protein